jgi:hypothetical protein
MDQHEEAEPTERPMIERIFLGYPTGFLRDVVNILRLLKQAGNTMDDFLAYAEKNFHEKEIMAFERQKQFELARNKYRANARRCVCGEIMRLASVNDRPGNQVGGNYKSQWVCPAAHTCGESVYSENDVEVEAMKYGISDLLPSKRQSKDVNPAAIDSYSSTSRRKNAAQRRPCGRSLRR